MDPKAAAAVPVLYTAAGDAKGSSGAAKSYTLTTGQSSPVTLYSLNESTTDAPAAFALPEPAQRGSVKEFQEGAPAGPVLGKNVQM